MEIRQLEYFVAVAEMGGFTRAAEVCHVVQTTVSHAVATLERELGVRLLDRTGRTHGSGPVLWRTGIRA